MCLHFIFLELCALYIILQTPYSCFGIEYDGEMYKTTIYTLHICGYRQYEYVRYMMKSVKQKSLLNHTPILNIITITTLSSPICAMPTNSLRT